MPFTAPLVRPATIRRWKSRTSSTTGIVTITAAAEIEPVGILELRGAGEAGQAAGTGRAASVEVSEMP